LRRLFTGDRLTDVPAHFTRASAALGALATGPEHVHWTAGPRPHGGINITLANGSADTDIHGRFGRFSMRLRLTRKEKIRGIRNWVKGQFPPNESG
jgi:hypothetical protein